MVNVDRVLSRTRKMVTKYTGPMHYELSGSDDPANPTCGHIMSAGDLDKTKGPLFAA
jgi:hypothetical protein